MSARTRAARRSLSVQCPCGKAGFRSLRVARAVGRGVYPGAKRVATFWCPVAPSIWHFKHTA